MQQSTTVTMSTIKDFSAMSITRKYNQFIHVHVSSLQVILHQVPEIFAICSRSAELSELLRENSSDFASCSVQISSLQTSQLAEVHR